MDRPVISVGLPELACPVERVDDPHAARGQASLVGDALFGQHRVFGRVLSESVDDELMGPAVALGAQDFRVAGKRASQREEECASLFGDN
jgi:hypothetical protein